MSSTARGPRWRLAFIAVLALSAALLVAACGDDDDDGGGGGGGGGGDGYTMTLIAGVRGDEFYITMNCGAQEEARKQGVELDFQGPDQFDASLQTPIVNAVTQKKPDAILIAPTDTKAMYVPIKAAADAGITIVLVDTTLEQADMAVSQIASDNEAGGREAAKALADLIGGEGKVFVSNVKPGHLDHRRARPGLRGRSQEARPRLRRHGIQRRRPGQGGGDRQGAARQEPRPRGHLRDQPVLGRGLGDRRARGRQERRRQDRGLRRRPQADGGPRQRARSRRSSPRSPPTSASSASSRRWRRSTASRPRRRSAPAR